jgi:DNA repair protein RecO (recombination protein O)
MIHHTKGVVLRAIKYGETSLVVSILTEKFGIQSYLVNGVRNSKHSKSNYFQPSSLLEMQVYHNELRNLQRIKEYKWSYVYSAVLSDVTKNAVALYMVELLHRSLKQPEANEELFAFVEDAFIKLDKSAISVTANYPLYFAIQLPQFFGFQIYDRYSEEERILDMQEGRFTNEVPEHNFYLTGDDAYTTSELLKTLHPDELINLKLNKVSRRHLLLAYQSYYSYHIQDFGVMKTLPVLQEILG